MLLIPGCDRLVTEENYSFDTLYDTTYIYEADNTCGLCHDDQIDSIDIAVRQWANSIHAEGNYLDYAYLGNTTSECGPECHTSQGFVTSLNTEPTAVAYPTEIGCFTCHSPHESRDFNLRTTAMVTLVTDITYNKENSNICARCHQSTFDPPTESFTSQEITAGWGPHFSVEADMFLGTGGYLYSGYTYGGSDHNAIGDGCLRCHQDSARGFVLGGHSLNIEEDGEDLVGACNTVACHAGDITDIFDINTTIGAAQGALLDSLDTLKTILMGMNLLDDSDLPVPGTLRGADTAGALYNYLFVRKDSSLGVHNLTYASDLVNSALEFLRSAPAGPE